MRRIKTDSIQTTCYKASAAELAKAINELRIQVKYSRAPTKASLAGS